MATYVDSIVASPRLESLFVERTTFDIKLGRFRGRGECCEPQQVRIIFQYLYIQINYMQVSVIPVRGCYPDVGNAQLVDVKASSFKQQRKIKGYLPSGCT